MVHKIFNASNILGAIAFLAMLLAPAFAEDNPFMSIVMVVIFAACAYLSMKEDGQIK